MAHWPRPTGLTRDPAPLSLTFSLSLTHLSNAPNPKPSLSLFATPLSRPLILCPCDQRHVRCCRPSRRRQIIADILLSEPSSFISSHCFQRDFSPPPPPSLPLSRRLRSGASLVVDVSRRWKATSSLSLSQGPEYLTLSLSYLIFSRKHTTTSLEPRFPPPSLVKFRRGTCRAQTSLWPS